MYVCRRQLELLGYLLQAPMLINTPDCRIITRALLLKAGKDNECVVSLEGGREGGMIDCYAYSNATTIFK